MNEKRSNNGVIYIVSDGEFIKIGKSYDAQKRLSMLQTGNARKLKVLNTFKTDNMTLCERKLQEKFQAYHVNNEWFNIPKDNPHLMRLLHRKGFFYNDVLFHENLFMFGSLTKKGKDYIDNVVGKLFVALVLNERTVLNSYIDKFKKISDMSCIVIDMCVGNLVVTKQPQQIQASETETESELDLECFLPHFYVDSWLKFFLEEARKGKIIQVVEDYGASIGGVFFCEKREETRIRKEYPEEPEIIFYFNQQDS